jgi:hypothetical protein
MLGLRLWTAAERLPVNLLYLGVGEFLAGRQVNMDAAFAALGISKFYLWHEGKPV